LDDVLCYMEYYDCYINSLDLTDRREGFWKPHIRELFPSWSESPSLVSLQLNGFTVQLQACDRFAGVLGAAAQVAALTKLTLRNCNLPFSAQFREGSNALAAAVSLLPTGLQYLSLDSPHTNNSTTHWLRLPTVELQRLQQLTYLEVAKVLLVGPDKATPALQPLQALTRLVDLRILMDGDDPERGYDEYGVPASMLSGAKHLTRLQLSGCRLEAGALAGVTQLQHLHVKGVRHQPRDRAAGAGAAEATSLLSNLQPLQQLTFLCLPGALQASGDRNPPAAAYAALTASSKLVQLDLTGCALPASAWRKMFPVGRQLPHLQRLDMTDVTQRYAVVPDFIPLVACCPGLQCLYMGGWQDYYRGQRWFIPTAAGGPRRSTLAPLQGLSALHTLHLAPHHPVEKAIIESRQLTGLRQLHFDFPQSVWSLQDAIVQNMTQMTQLTALSYRGPGRGQGRDDGVEMKSEVSVDWLLLSHRSCLWLSMASWLPDLAVLLPLFALFAGVLHCCLPHVCLPQQ
jgi:hypothetical protein